MNGTAMHADSAPGEAATDSEYSESFPTKETLAELGRRLPGTAKRYVLEIFPIVQWLPHYNLKWGLGDVIAGFTIGMMLVPQALALARLAGLPPEYGLYSSLFGTLIYCVFATSKDITIGPTAVLSLALGQILDRINPEATAASNVAYATVLALTTGIATLGIGLLRLGFIVDFIPNPVISGFTTGAAVTVVISQLPALFGITGVDTRAYTYQIVVNTFRNIGTANWVDCLFGLISAAALLSIKFFSRKYGKRSLAIWFFGVSRFALVVLFSILVSWLINRATPDAPYNAILQTVPTGFTYIAIPPIADPNFAIPVLSGLPILVLLALLEHISIAKSFGRVNGYKVTPSQESIAIGVTNIVASFFGAFPSTGSYSRTAVNSQAGVRTPLSGIVTGIIVVLAVFVLAPMFFWIPNATLAAVIMHGITELVSPPSFFKKLWQISKADCAITLITVILCVILTIEVAVIVSVCLALVFLLLRVALPTYSLLARDKGTGEWTAISELQSGKKNIVVAPPGVLIFRLEEALIYPNSNRIRAEVSDVIAATTKDQTPQSVVISGRAQEGKSWSEYGNKLERQEVDVEFGQIVKAIVGEWQGSCVVEEDIGIKDETGVSRPDTVNTVAAKEADLSASVVLISDQLGGTTKPSFSNLDKPPLRALIFDFSAVNTVDSTGAQTLLDLLSDANRRAGGTHGVQMHFVHARRRVRHVLERSGIVAAQIPVPIAEEGGIQLENVEIAVEGWTAGSQEMTFDAWRSNKALDFKHAESKGSQTAANGHAAVPAQMPAGGQDLGVSKMVVCEGVAVGGQGADSRAVIIPIAAQTPSSANLARKSVSSARRTTDPRDTVTTPTGIQERALTTPEEVLKATDKYSARYMHGNMDDAIEAIEEIERVRAV